MTGEAARRRRDPVGKDPAEDGRSSIPGTSLPRPSHRLLALCLVLAAFVGVFLVRSYGVSWDEPDNAAVGEAARRVYTGSKDYFAMSALSEHGPLYFMIFSATSEAIHAFLPVWSLPDGRHITTYATFLFGAICFYVICLRLFRRKSALMATLLFLTQPILFGSAFVNQKDIPFMTFFLAVIASGLVGVDGWKAFSGDRPDRPPEGLRAIALLFKHRLAEEWRVLDERARRNLIVLLGLAALIIADLSFIGGLRHLGEAVLRAAYDGRAFWPIQQLFDRVAVDAYKTPFRLYLDKFSKLFSYVRLGASAALILTSLAYLGRKFESIGSLWKGTWTRDRYPFWVVSAIFLGCAICVRQVGIFAGALLTVYMLYRGRARSFLPLLIFWVVAALVAYATWPYLWGDPLQRILQSFSAVDAYARHTVVFRGQVIFTSNLPWYYFPEFAGVQLTEPALVLGGLGLIVLAWKSLRRTSDPAVFGLVVGWIGAPTYRLMFHGAGIYGGIRHLFFLLPPVLIFAGAGIEAILDTVQGHWPRRALLSLILIPGLWGIISLQPYEYTYFNSFVGGAGGAYGRYSQDYWCTSIKEGTEEVNRVAGPAEALMIFGQVQNAIPYARSDLQIESQYSPLWKADFVVLCKDVRSARWDPGDFQLIYQVHRGRAVYAEVWQRIRPASPSGDS